MRYRRRYRSRTRRYRRPSRRFVRKGRSFSRKVKSVMYRTTENKQVNYNVNTIPSSTIVYFRFANSIVQGAGDNQRIANQVFARGWSAKFEFTCPTNQSPNIRIWVVWPRALSSSDATAAITASNFPLTGVVDQDNWIVWEDTTFHMQNPADYGRPNYYRWEFYKRFPVKLEWPSAADVIPKKNAYIVINTPYLGVGTSGYNLTGYVKLSYKDI